MMSVVFQNSSGWVLDSRSLIDRGYERCIKWTGHQKSHFKCSFKRQCFKIVKTHYNLSGSAAVDGELTAMIPSKVNTATKAAVTDTEGKDKIIKNSNYVCHTEAFHLVEYKHKCVEAFFPRADAS